MAPSAENGTLTACLWDLGAQRLSTLTQWQDLLRTVKTMGNCLAARGTVLCPQHSRLYLNRSSRRRPFVKPHKLREAAQFDVCWADSSGGPPETLREHLEAALPLEISNGSPSDFPATVIIINPSPMLRPALERLEKSKRRIWLISTGEKLPRDLLVLASRYDHARLW